MRLAAGQTLSCYEILAPLGAGGMGEVYRARDTRLEREVAIKVLPEELADDDERLRRFEREARALASLRHPNVAQIYAIDQEGGTTFMAMELVPGENLATRLSRGRLDVGEVLDICRQIAEGLEAAHEAGVVHRDLKPANVMISPGGEVKLLDFGLAKSVRLGGATAAETELLTTEEGRLLGTPSYMAPEQARGKRIDRRIDVWAFGCVLYECLTGRRAFSGGGLSEVLVAILEREPDWSLVPAGTPERVRVLLARCLDKDPRSRLRDSGEARIVLEGEAAAPAGVCHPPGRRGRPVAAALIVVALGIGAVGVRYAFLGGTPPPLPAIRQERLTEMVGMEQMPAVSPDGSKVAFVFRVNGKQQVFLRLLAKGSWKQITVEEADHSFPRWADEDTLVYFVHPEREGAVGSLWESDFLGSSTRLLVPSAQGEADVDHAGRIATFRTDEEGPALVLIEGRGDGPETVLRMPPGVHRSPRWSPDDRRVAFEARMSLNDAEIRVIDLDGGQTRTVARIAGQTRGLAWLSDGSGLVYSSSEGSTLPYPPVFSLRTVRLDGSGDSPLPCEGAGYASYVEPDVTVDGALVASRVALESDVFRFPVDGTPLENAENMERITNQTGLVQVPSASPDGEEVAYLSDSGGHANVWVARVDGSEQPRKLTHEQDPDTIIGIPLWSPRGDWITYWRGPARGLSEQWLIRRDGTGERLLVVARGGASWSSDGEWLYYMAQTDDPSEPSTERISIDGGEVVHVRTGAGGMLVSSDGSTAYFNRSDFAQGTIWKATPVETGTPEPLREDLEARIPFWPHMYALSPDDRWLATPLRDQGTTNLWRISTADGSLEPLTDFGRRATTIGRQVSWSGDGRFLFAALMENDADIVLLQGVLP